MREANSRKKLITIRPGAIIWPAAFSSDGRHFVTGTQGLTATVWDANSANVLLIRKGHSYKSPRQGTGLQSGPISVVAGKPRALMRRVGGVFKQALRKADPRSRR